jgi:nucleotide-binding universal stress UspA family protein
VVTQNFEGFFNIGDLLDALRDSGKKAIHNALALTRKHDVKADAALYETMGGRVSDVIVREAKKWKADLIVMGTHGRRGINRMVLGSDAEAVLRTAPVPVLMVRSPDRKKRARKK